MLPNYSKILKSTIIVILLILLSQIDDDLSTTSLSLIESFQPTKESNAYLYLAGIYAHSDESPLETGKQLLSEYRKHEADITYEIQEYPENKKLALPDEDFFCSLYKDDCIDILFNHKTDLINLSNKYKTLVSRVNTFHQFNEYSTQTRPALDEPLPYYSYITKAEDIISFSAIHAFKQGQVDLASEILINQISNLRHSLALQDTLIGKMIFLVKLSHAIDLLSIICAESNQTIEKIPTLMSQEKDLSVVAAREFGISYQLLNSLDKHPEIFELKGNLPEWMIRVVYKPNMSVNAIAPIYSRLAQLSSLTPTEFVVAQKETTPQPSIFSYIRNPIGNILVRISPNFDEYIARFMDLDAKIILFNHLHVSQTELTDIINPYYTNEKAFIDGKKACFRGPIGDHRSIRCLRFGL